MCFEIYYFQKRLEKKLDEFLKDSLTSGQRTAENSRDIDISILTFLGFEINL